MLSNKCKEYELLLVDQASHQNKQMDMIRMLREKKKLEEKVHSKDKYEFKTTPSN